MMDRACTSASFKAEIGELEQMTVTADAGSSS
jgi:hypothetical protein